jgi:excisionase family DNA binding protein
VDQRAREGMKPIESTPSARSDGNSYARLAQLYLEEVERSREQDRRIAALETRLDAMAAISKRPVTVAQAAVILGCGKKRVWQLIHDGKLSAWRDGKGFTIEQAEIERHKQETVIEPKARPAERPARQPRQRPAVDHDRVADTFRGLRS